jgi:hypothetical protein
MTEDQIPAGEEAQEVIKSPKVPTLDPAALIGLPGRFVDLVRKNSEADPAAVLITLLVRFGVEIGTGPKMYIGDTTHHPRLFAVIVGETSKARKGTSAQPVKKLFEKVKSVARTSPGPLSSGEGLIYAVRDASEKSDDFLTDAGVKDKRLFILDEEFAGALECSKRKGNTLSTIIRQAWDNGDIEPLTKNSKISVTGAHIGIVTHITIRELLQKFNSTESYSGFANRFIWVFSTRSKIVPLPIPMPEDELSNFRIELEKILETAKKDQVVEFDEAAKELWKKEYPELSTDHPGQVGAIINRGEAQVIRLSMIYCLLDGKDKISVSHLKSALAVWKYCVDSTYHIFGSRQSGSVSQKIVEGLLSGPLDRTGISKLFNNHKTKVELDVALDELLQEDKIWKEADNSTGGRTREIYRLAGA